MVERPSLRTPRLLLRPFSMEDAPEVARLCGDRAIAETTLAIPHPYELAHAIDFLAGRPESFESGRAVDFALTLQENGALVGAIGVMIEREHSRAEVGYWIGVPYWGRGYATEALRAVLAWGFENAGLQRIFAHVFPRNAASARVLEKAGLKPEGTLRRHFKKGDAYEDALVYAILKDEWR